MELKFRGATTGDIPSLERLVNSAYRGEESVKGWTNENHLFSGKIVDVKMLKERMTTPQAVILLAEKNNILAGCVRLRITDKGCYLGLLAVSPELQDSGVGRCILEQSEKWAKEQKQNKIYMQVINTRKELIAWYERRGFSANGETLNFEPSEIDMIRPGVSRGQLDFVFLEKNI